MKRFGRASVAKTLFHSDKQTMIYIHSLGRASRYYGQRTALVVDSATVSFKALHERVQNIAAALAPKGSAAGDLFKDIISFGVAFYLISYYGRKAIVAENQ